MKKRILWINGLKISEKWPVTPEDLRYVMGAETASTGTGTTTDPTVKDTPPPP